ncbi:MAG: hypothetical protein IKQ06_05965 [Bacilli bacterium]|nr:hypothetical protein [Bacilli bacterium]MBR6137683.1 hypothetical protein [Bacilli bacterium]
MNTKFIVNDYALIWNLLFQSAIDDSFSKEKAKLWNTYKEEYNQTYKDKMAIMKDYKNFIPNDDTIYNVVIENKSYDKLKKQAEKYRLEVMKLWDKNKKEADNLITKITRLNIPEYTFFVVNKELGIIDHPTRGSMVLGKTIDGRNPFMMLYEIMMNIVMNNIKVYNESEKDFKKAIVELAVLNEYATGLNKRSCYLSGDPKLLSLKRWIYPYWLMYLGVAKEDFHTYMARDKVSFDTERYAYEKELKKMNLEEFIDFCIRNKRYIIRDPKQQ